jgi:murein DD-endopeptidase MepM/ murein hydrolase activator NlpD
VTGPGLRAAAVGLALGLLLAAPVAAAPPPLALAVPPLVTPALGGGPRVFPVFGAFPPADTFGAPRDDVSGGWHHGDDIFAPGGTPVLACADGVVFSVGWNRIGGWRLWLVDRQGNEYYYAHLSAYSAYGVNGAVVHAGDVLGFVGHSGDARTTPDHIDFEIHPVALLPLGYDGAVDPTRYLRAWRRLERIPARAAAGWKPGPSRAASS